MKVNTKRRSEAIACCKYQTGQDFAGDDCEGFDNGTLTYGRCSVLETGDNLAGIDRMEYLATMSSCDMVVVARSWLGTFGRH